MRENTNNYQQTEIFKQPSSRLSIGDRDYDRNPYEELRLEYGQDGHEYHARMGEDKKIVWCVMCFGRDAQLQPHLERSMCLSFGLRHQLAPILQRKYGISFANVMFVTEESLDKASFQALALYWSMKVVPLPEVHPKRIEGVSWHLRDDHIRPEHVFLKFWTWSMRSEIAIISDVDVIISNPEKLADALSEYVREGELKTMQQTYKVSCMCRVKSLVGFGEDYKPQVVDQNINRPDNLSYCFAIVTPDASGAERYVEELSEEPKNHQGKLSDQDFFSWYNRLGYILLHQNFMAFMSWWNHEPLMHRLITCIIQVSVDFAPPDQLKNWWTTKEFAKFLFEKFGAVHCSSAFDVVKSRTKTQFFKEFMAKGQRTWVITFKLPREYNRDKDSIKVRRSVWVSTLCWNMNVVCREKSMEIVEELHKSIKNYTGAGTPEPHMSKAFFCLTFALDRKKEDTWMLEEEITIKYEEETGKLIRVKKEEDNEDRGESRGPPWKRQRSLAGEATSSTEKVRPWNKNEKKEKSSKASRG